MTGSAGRRPDRTPRADDAGRCCATTTPSPWSSPRPGTQAEAKLYPAVTTRPDLYQRVLTIVARTVERLRGLGPSTGALLAAAERGPDLVAEVLAEHGLSASELDLDLLARAALAMRHREVSAEQAARRRLRLVAEGHRAGHAGSSSRSAGTARATRSCPTSGSRWRCHRPGLLVTARGDDEFRHVLHAVEELRVDLADGRRRRAGRRGRCTVVAPGSRRAGGARRACPSGVPARLTDPYRPTDVSVW